MKLLSIQPMTSNRGERLRLLRVGGGEVGRRGTSLGAQDPRHTHRGPRPDRSAATGGHWVNQTNTPLGWKVTEIGGHKDEGVPEMGVT